MRISSFRKVFAFVLTALALSACGNSLKWTEDVLLPDGRVITLNRWAEFEGGSSHFGQPSVESRQTFEFQHPDTGEIVKWRSDMEQGGSKDDHLYGHAGDDALKGAEGKGYLDGGANADSPLCIKVLATIKTPLKSGLAQRVHTH